MSDDVNDIPYEPMPPKATFAFDANEPRDDNPTQYALSLLVQMTAYLESIDALLAASVELLTRIADAVAPKEGT